MFQFDDTYFRKIEGGAILLLACGLWFILSLVEHLILESKYRKNILVLVRFIDDMFIIWRKIKAQPDDWKGFKRCLNQVSNLNWVCEELGKRVVFLYLEIRIDRMEKICMHKLHTKEISLLSCLSPHSAHPKEFWKGMIYGLLSKRWRRCCREADYVVELQQLCRGMVNRGHCS